MSRKDPPGTTSRPTVLIVGAGLGGCVVAHALADTHDVTVVELGVLVSDMQARLKDIGVPARLDPHVGAGPGGTTALWHNGLIEVSESVFDECWPFPKSEMAPWYDEAYRLLGGVERFLVEDAGAALRGKFREAGLAADQMPTMFIPARRRNLWETLSLRDRVRFVRGEVTRLEVDGGNRVRQAVVATENGEQRLQADLFVLAAVGLGTPVLLQALADEVPLPALRLAGCFYEDHPMAFVGLVTLRVPLYRFWNYRVPRAGGSLRMPLVVHHDGLQVSFQLRPAVKEGQREKVATMITQLRNNPLNLLNYFRVLRHPDDLLDILSYRFGIRLPTRHYSLLMVAEQPRTPERSVSSEVDPVSAQRWITRNWQLSAAYLSTLRNAITGFIAGLGNIVISSRVFANWDQSLDTAAHHSGTARMSASASDGVCDRNARVHGMQNLFVADGSLLPGTGIANTGLTIAAAALRLGHHLKAGQGD